MRLKHLMHCFSSPPGCWLCGFGTNLQFLNSGGKDSQSVLAAMTYFVFPSPWRGCPSLDFSPQALNSTPQPFFLADVLAPCFQDTKGKGTLHTDSLFPLLISVLSCIPSFVCSSPASYLSPRATLPTFGFISSPARSSIKGISSPLSLSLLQWHCPFSMEMCLRLSFCERNKTTFF